MIGNIRKVLEKYDYDKVFALTDTNVHSKVRIGWDFFDSVKTIPAGEASKSLATAASVWQWLCDSGATRRSLLVNVGGGVITDLGGFCAATFKRGIRFINVPTSLLAIADAAIGGKTGIDFNGLKNEIGVFCPAEEVVIFPGVLDTLPDAELRSGFAEVVKMAILTDPDLYEELLAPDALGNRQLMARAMRHAADAKQRIVDIDPREKGLRRILNFGHTVGHAYESLAAELGKPISHGEAVAHGMLEALKRSRDQKGLPAECITQYKEKILDRYYSPLPFGPESDARLRQLMSHDKKNRKSGEILFILVSKIGEYGDFA